MNSEFPRMESPQSSKLGLLKARIEAARDAHDFDLEKIGIENGEVNAISELLDMSDRAQDFRDPSFEWTSEDTARFKDVRKMVEDVIARLEGSSDESDEGMLRAFLNNKITLIDLAALYASRKRETRA